MMVIESTISPESTMSRTSWNRWGRTWNDSVAFGAGGSIALVRSKARNK